MRDDGGWTLVELLVTMVAATTILIAIGTIVTLTLRQQEFVADRVASNQKARPAMTQVINTLHSSCVAPGVAPVQANSTGSSLTVYSKSGSTVTPVPNRHQITLSGSTLSESVTTGAGTAPNWTFPGPTTTRALLTGVSTPGGVPLFRYYAYENGAISTTPLPTPLSAANAARTVQVTVAFAAAPGDDPTPATDANSPIVLSDSAILRLSAASEDLTEVNTPCV